mgnify:CR=1 FL=1
MNKKHLTCLFIFFSVFAWGQKKIDTPLTNEHVHIKGTKISLVPPEGFTEAINFLGLQEIEMGASIMVVELPGPYSETSGGINKESLLSKGVILKNIEKLIINGLPAMMITGTQKAYGNNFTKYMLVMGTEKETIIVNGALPEYLNESGEKIKESLLTIYYEENKQTDPFATIDFSIDVTGTKLKFAKNIANSLIFTTDGMVPTNSADKTNLIVAKSISPMLQEDKKLYSLNRIRQTPFKIDTITHVREISIDGISGYEIFANGKSEKSDETESIYQVILFNDEFYYILFGTTNDPTDKSMDDIKKAILTFKRK